MIRVARIAGFVVLMLGGQIACADQGLAPLWVAAPGPGAPSLTYNPNVSAPLWLPPPPPTRGAPAVVTPMVPVVAAPAGPVITYRPVLPVIPMPGQYYVGRGLLGQPKLYVPNQPLRNFVRYLSP